MGFSCGMDTIEDLTISETSPACSVKYTGAFQACQLADLQLTAGRVYSCAALMLFPVTCLLESAHCCGLCR